MNIASTELQEEWKRVIAYAWANSDFRDKLLKNPKKTLEDSQIREELNLTLLDGNYLPLPDTPTSQDHPELPEEPTEDDYERLLDNPEKVKKFFGEMQLCCI